jgi:5'(3')-deoxyribonucleotidase
MKRDLIIDFDGTIADSGKRIYNLYNERHCLNGVPFKREDLKWNFKPYITDKDARIECLSYFSDPKMYELLEWIDEYTKDAIAELSKNYNIIICSRREKGSYEPLLEWLEQNMPCEYQICFLSSFDKGVVGRRGSIIIDDKPSCLLGNKDRFKKILFGNYGYQQDEILEMDFMSVKELNENLVKCNTWKDILRELK